MPLTTNEGKCCDAVLCHLERRHSALRANVRQHDNNAIREARVELTFSLGERTFAMEHTLVEPFEGFLAQNNSDAQSVRDVERELRSRLPTDSDFLLYIPSTCFDGRTKAQIARTKRTLVEAVIDAAAAAPIEPTYRGGAGITINAPALGFELGFRRFERTIEQPQLRIFRTVEDVVVQRRERMKRACEEKQGKLAWWRTGGARTILVLENNDVQLSNQHSIADALVEAEAELGPVADEVHLIGTYIDNSWFATRLRIDAVRFPAMYSPGELIAESVDPARLRDLTRSGS